MSILAIARVLNDTDMLGMVGWEAGYRLIDTKTRQIRDVSDEMIKKGFEKGIYIKNLKLTHKGTRISPMVPGKTRVAWFPVIGVTPYREFIIPLDEETKRATEWVNRVFMLAFKYIVGGNRAAIALCLVCDPLGREVKVVRYGEIENDLILNDLSDIKEEGFDETWLFNQDATDYTKRCRAIGANYLQLVDKMNGGVEVVSSGRAWEGDLLIPDFVTEIGVEAFQNTTLGTVIFGANVQKVGRAAFYGATIENIALNEGLTYFGEEVFKGCEIRKDLIVSSTVKEIRIHTFQKMKCRRFVIKSDKWTYYPKTSKSFLTSWWHTTGNRCELCITRWTANYMVKYYLEGQGKWKKLMVNASKEVEEVMERLLDSTSHFHVERVTILTDEQVAIIFKAILDFADITGEKKDKIVTILG